MKKFIIILLTCLLSINIFSGCNESTKNNTKKTEKQITIDKPNFKTKTIKTESASYKIPDSWENYDIEADTDKYNVKAYAPTNNIENSILSTINVCEEKSAIHITDIDDTVKESYIEQIQKIYKSACNFKFSDFTAISGDVFVIEYDISEESQKITGHITQYMLMLKNKTVLVTASNLDKTLDINPSDAAKYLVETYKSK